MRVPISAAPLTVTVTPGRTALVLSVTRPSIAPIVALTVCAAARPAIKGPTRSSAATARRITPSLRKPRPGAADCRLLEIPPNPESRGTWIEHRDELLEARPCDGAEPGDGVGVERVEQVHHPGDFSGAANPEALLEPEIDDVHVRGAVGADRFHQDRLAAGVRQRDAGVPAPVVAALQLVGAADADVVREHVASEHLVIPVGRCLASEPPEVRLPDHVAVAGRRARRLPNHVKRAGRGDRAAEVVCPG